ncbi:MAG: long-chain fatty acid--CoA ligase [Bacteroidales bacterium]
MTEETLETVIEQPTDQLPRFVYSLIGKYKQQSVLGYKTPEQKWEYVSWYNMGMYIQQFAMALLNFHTKSAENVGICAPNMPEWLISDLAIQSIRAVSVPLYPGESEERMHYILEETKMQTLIIGEGRQIAMAQELLAKTTDLKRVIVLNAGPEYDLPENFYSYKELIEKTHLDIVHDRFDNRLTKAHPNDIATIIYTSGTTGNPKGVTLTHTNFIRSIELHKQRLQFLKSKDRTLSFLPLSHVYERTWVYVALSLGMQIAFLNDPKQIMVALKEVKPMTMCAVPRFFEKSYATIHHNIAKKSWIKQRIFDWAIKRGTKYRQNIKEDKHPPFFSRQLGYLLADMLVLKKIRKAFGGHIKFISSAGAILDSSIMEFFHSCGVFVMGGYGLTESTATVTTFKTKHYSYNSVGVPLDEIEVRISSTGEVLVKGDTITPGYYKKPKETKETIKNGWLHTGDIGYFNDRRELILTDRKKDIQKSSSGKSITPQPLEHKLQTNPYIDQVAVIGEGRKFLTALIVPDFEKLKEFAKEHLIQYNNLNELLVNPNIVHFYNTHIQSLQQEFAEYHQVKKFALLGQPFTAEGGDITQTGKLRRAFIAKKYSSLINSFYESKS